MRIAIVDDISEERTLLRNRLESQFSRRNVHVDIFEYENGETFLTAAKECPFTVVFLDIYMNGRRQYEFLKLYIIPEHNQADKKRNVETLNLANAIKAQKILEIYNQTYGFNHNRLSNMKLTGYMKLIAEQSVNNRVRKSAIHAVVCHLERYTPNGILLRKVDKTYLLGFIDYLKKTKQEHCKKEKTLHVNTQFYYLKTLRYCLNRAVSEDYITVNPMNKIKNEDKPKRNRTERDYLL